MKPGVLGTLAVQFALLSLLAIGGANATLPEMHRLAVESEGWMTDRTFVDLFALAQAAPGPNFLVVTIIGWHVAGLAGAVVATLAMCGPSCLLAYGVGGLWRRFETAPWRRAIQAGIAPVTVGLVAASAWILAGAAHHGAGTALLTAGAAALAFWTRLNPLWLLATGVLAGAVGLA